jgi:hypothetical protein
MVLVVSSSMMEARATVVNGGWSRWWKKPSGIKGRLMQFFVTFRERESTCEGEGVTGELRWEKETGLFLLYVCWIVWERVLVCE